ncbi:MAG: hypothetical protein JNM84_21905 [Planctomycetes bacterium]|nr:hypothetical protein [Planctomycetota bacterium]
MRPPRLALLRGTSALARSLAHRALLAVALLAALACSGCLRVRETFEIAPDLSGRVHLVVHVPTAFLPGGRANLRLGSEDLILPTGVELRRHAVDEDLRTGEARFELVLAFAEIQQLSGVALRYPGSRGAPGIHPWRGLGARRAAHHIDFERAAYGTGEISPELLDSVPEGRLAAAALRWTTLFVFDGSWRASWIAPAGGWQALPGSRRRQWSRTASWGELLRAPNETLRALLPLSFSAQCARAFEGALRGLLGASPWLGLALWLAWTRPRRETGAALLRSR